MAAVIFGKKVTVLDDNTLHRAVRCWEQVGTVWSFHRYTWTRTLRAEDIGKAAMSSRAPAAVDRENRG
jgi:hypothetical protein